MTYAQRYPFYNLNVERGLIQSQATSLAQDHLGHLWVGTIGGLSRYDGNTFVSYTVRDGMLDNTVNALATDKTGNLWIGSSKCLSVYDGRAYKHYILTERETQNANSVADIKIAADNTVWCRAGGRVYYVAGGKKAELEIPDSMTAVTAILPDGNGLWIGSNRGIVYRYDAGKWDSLKFNEPRFAVQPTVLSIFKDSRGRIWLGTNGGLYNINGGKITVAKASGEDLYAVPLLLSICEDNNKSLWFGTTTGAMRLKDSTVTYYRKNNGLTDNTINEVLTDAEGNIWLASDGQGLFRFSGAQFTVLDESIKLPSAQIMSITTYFGKLYLGTYDAGLYTYESGQAFKVPLPAPSQGIMAMRVRKGELWMAVRNAGLWRYNGSIFKSYYAPDINSNLVTSLYTDTSSRLWIGTINGATLYNGDSFKRLPLRNTPVQDFILIGEDSVLMATDDGLQLYHGGSVHPFITNGAPDSATAQCFTLRGRELWIGTSDNGIIVYNLENNTSFVINKSNGLYSDFIYNIITDDQGNVWTGTGYGIHKIMMRDNMPVIAFYGKEQGVMGMESNHNAVYKMRDGSIWFGTTNGALHYHPESHVVQSRPVSIVLQSVKVFGETITDTSYYDSTDAWYKVPYDLHLPYRKNNITFTFHAISLSGSEQVRYRYRIEGLDAQWSDWSSVNSVTYSALPPGKYVLHVDCLTESGANVQELNYPFEIITPFHKTGWFRLAILGACILLGVSIQYAFNKRKQNRQALLDRLRREEQTKVRIRTAEDFHDEVGNRLTRINVLTNVLQKKLGYISPEARRIIEQIRDNADQLYGGTRDILWSLKPSNDNLYEILNRIRDFGGELFQDTDVDFYFYGTDEKWQKYRLPMDVSRNLIMIFKEALNNCLKYSKAKEVKLEAAIKDMDVFQLVLKDNGTGFDLETVQKGHGIANMNVRAKRINGILYIDTKPGQGTIITLTFRLPPKTK